MSGSVPAAQPRAVDEEAAYYQAVEEFFVSRRGDPLFLSSADWLLVRDWRLAGIPLRIVLRGIEDALDSHAHSWSRDRKVGSLRYCAAEVDLARERWERALSTGTEPGDSEAARARLVAALETASGPGAESERLSREILRGLLAAEARRGPRETEAWLAEQELHLVALIRREDPELATRALEEVSAEMAPYRVRMPADVARQIEENALTRRVLAARGLPRLSLFLQ
ncbi:MAG: hypothetical protein ACHQNV_02145 [Vicinamibacteria bacterium]